MYISLYDLGLIISFLLLVIMGGYIIMLLRRAICTLGLVHDVLAENRSDINKTVILLQDTLANINDLTANLGEMMSQTNKTVRALPEDVADMVDDLRDSIENFAVYAKIITDVVKALFSK